MTKYTATIVTANLRDVEGCDSDNAVDAIYAAAERAAGKYADINGIDLTVEPYTPARDRQGQTVLVSHDCWGQDVSATLAADKAAEDIRDALDYAIDRAIEAGDWEDAA